MVKEFKRAELLKECVELLDKNGLEENSACEANWVFEDITGNADNITAEQAEKIKAIISRRCEGYPLQYLLGEWEFYGLKFKVGEGVLIPRQDTETAVDIALKMFKDKSDITVIDLCSGSGCIGVTLDKNLSCKKVLCIERSPQAVEYLKTNVRSNASKAELLLGDVKDESVINAAPMADLIICNPPYLTAEDMENLQREVTFEPKEALFGGEDGLDFYRDIVRKWKKKLKNGGVMLFEIGIGQEDEVMRLMIQHGFKNVRCRKDLCGVVRCVSGIFEE
ncbi:peptide chain release factor N(5)-glutamine methyltransferase [Ruminococcus sp.]|uniref:peptide chain release factor N(5)-glutamine methyltransferase n=1 Tax=Ruminococcus sp. TaxID=41978 RepID=UPI0025EB39A3|nr:peptide chain release factor N(5)-glutamine methyltransferase [Ruminococcus sp.]